jgi:hypothetical protein
MKLSRKGEYALRALICLGLGEVYGRKQRRVAEIAASDHIPEKFLKVSRFSVDLTQTKFDLAPAPLLSPVRRSRTWRTPSWLAIS